MGVHQGEPGTAEGALKVNRLGILQSRFGETKLQPLNRKSKTLDFDLINALTTAIHGVPGKA
jgi:hypothetical protein